MEDYNYDYDYDYDCDYNECNGIIINIPDSYVGIENDNLIFED